MDVEITKKVRCCDCGRTQKEHQRTVFFIEIPYIKEWQFPEFHNPVRNETSNLAMTALCLECNSKAPHEPKYAIEIQGKGITYHSISGLKKWNSIGQFKVIVQGAVVVLNSIQVDYNNGEVALLALDFNTKNVDFGRWHTDENGEINLIIFPPDSNEDAAGWRPYTGNSSRYTAHLVLKFLSANEREE